MLYEIYQAFHFLLIIRTISKNIANNKSTAEKLYAVSRE